MPATFEEFRKYRVPVDGFNVGRILLTILLIAGIYALAKHLEMSPEEMANRSLQSMCNHQRSNGRIVPPECWQK